MIHNSESSSMKMFIFIYNKIIINNNMEYTQETILNAFCAGVLVGPLLWMLIIAFIKTIFKIIERIDEATEKNIND